MTLRALAAGLAAILCAPAHAVPAATPEKPPGEPELLVGVYQAPMRGQPCNPDTWCQA